MSDELVQEEFVKKVEGGVVLVLVRVWYAQGAWRGR